ncbi:MAG: hypothetical protein DRO36_07075 [Candidatus Hecatellales archaeon]|nr:MAG: hypothetical protein DRO36_07075 [Candidatus Hecatellales archaeon]
MDVKLPIATRFRDLAVTDDKLNQIHYIAKATDYRQDILRYVAELRVNLKNAGYDLSEFEIEIDTQKDIVRITYEGQVIEV